MKPENELLAEEVAFVNTCEKMAEVLGGLDRGRHQFEVTIHDPETGERLGRFGTYNKSAANPRKVSTLDDLMELAASDYDGPILLKSSSLKILAGHLTAARNRIDDDTARINDLSAKYGALVAGNQSTAANEPGPLTLEEFDKIVRTGEAELPPINLPPLDIVEDRTIEQQKADGDFPSMVHVSEPVAAEMQRLEEELPFEAPYLGNAPKELIPDIVDEPTKTPKRKGK